MSTVRLMLKESSILLAASMIATGCGSEVDGVSTATFIEAERISLEEFKGLLDNQADVIIVDVRSRESYEAGHIPGAISMTYPDEIRARHHELPLDKTIIFYCS